MSKEKVRLETLPSTGLLRVSQILQFIPVSKSCWWAGVRSGKFPHPIKLSKRVTCWQARDIQKIVNGPPEINTDGQQVPSND